jgi:hypothetical protein
MSVSWNTYVYKYMCVYTHTHTHTHTHTPILLILTTYYKVGSSLMITFVDEETETRSNHATWP